MQEESKKENKKVVSKIISIVLWILLFLWMGACLLDLNRTHKEKDPLFCIKKETIKYEDGEVDSCLGLGYKIYHYKRASFNGIEYGPFWFKDRSNENKK